MAIQTFIGFVSGLYRKLFSGRYCSEESSTGIKNELLVGFLKGLFKTYSKQVHPKHLV